MLLALCKRSEGRRVRVISMSVTLSLRARPAVRAVRRKHGLLAGAFMLLFFSARSFYA